MRMSGYVGLAISMFIHPLPPPARPHANLRWYAKINLSLKINVRKKKNIFFFYFFGWTEGLRSKKKWVVFDWWFDGAGGRRVSG